MPKFLDEIELEMVAGKGGPGCISFAREKHMPRGGPDGGNGGDGGDVILIARTSRNTFSELKGRRIFRAGHGGPGEANNRSGRSGDDWVTWAMKRFGWPPSVTLAQPVRYLKLLEESMR